MTEASEQGEEWHELQSKARPELDGIITCIPPERILFIFQSQLETMGEV